ncbi:MAG: helix-turn-helix transcriptional regulator [Burkholderiaceae bacterium]|nr:helix-turn-helix transcriptional regulator [Burkholderiaceae bacterium]
MTQHNQFGRALKFARSIKGMSQEAFGDVSSRTYVSTLERGVYTPTLDKVEALAGAMSIHPLTLITLAYAEQVDAIDALFEEVRQEVVELLNKQG